MKALTWLRDRYRWWILDGILGAIIIAVAIATWRIHPWSAGILGYLLGEFMWRTSYDKQQALLDDVMADNEAHCAWVKSLADLVRTGEAKKAESKP